MESILNTVKKMLGLSEDYTPFDTDIIVHLNTYIAVLNQLGVGTEGFYVTDAESTWKDLLGDGYDKQYEMVKSYLYLRVRMVFDPPASSTLATAINENIAELGWRIRERADMTYEE